MDLPLTTCVLVSGGFLGAQALNATHNIIIKNIFIFVSPYLLKMNVK